MGTPAVPTLRIGNRVVGGGAPCFIIAEAGSNHNGRFDQALRLIDVAASAGADAVKFQLFRANKLYPKTAGRSDYLKVDRAIYDIIADMELPYEWLPELVRHCRERGVIFLASVFDEESADRLDPCVSAHKIASYEMMHLPLVRHIAAKGKPVIMSTGTATLDEVREAVEAVRTNGNPPLALMQCTAAYPAPLESLNVKTITTMQRTFGVPVGLSDHSDDPLVGPLAAVALGAALLEKHYTFSHDLPGPDHRFALEPEALRCMVRKVREVERALGNGDKTPHAIEGELRAFARRSIFAVRPIPTGASLTADNVAVLRCGKQPAGLPPKELPRVLGRTVARAIEPGVAVQADDLA